MRLPKQRALFVAVFTLMIWIVFQSQHPTFGLLMHPAWPSATLSRYSSAWPGYHTSGSWKYVAPRGQDVHPEILRISIQPNNWHHSPETTDGHMISAAVLGLVTGIMAACAFFMPRRQLPVDLAMFAIGGVTGEAQVAESQTTKVGVVQPMKQDGRQTGTCVKWLDDMGFGFIEPDNSSEMVFVHHVEIRTNGYRDLGIGERVEFSKVLDGRGRPQATNVTAVGGGPPAGSAWYNIKIGTVASWIPDKGYGWIQPDDGSPWIFIHQREVFAGPNGFRALRVGDTVEYQVLKDKLGRLHAARVTAPNGQPISGMAPPRDFPLEKLLTVPAKNTQLEDVQVQPPTPRVTESAEPLHCKFLGDRRIRVKDLEMPRLQSPVIDIGLNLTHWQFSGRVHELLQRAHWANVRHMVVTCTKLSSAEQAMELLESYPNLLTCTLGIHPHDAKTMCPTVMEKFKQLLNDPSNKDKIVAIGECGLDFDRNYSPPEVQEQVFRDQVLLAKATGLPLFCHERGAHAKFIQILEECEVDWSKVCVHCFTGTEEELEKYVDLGCYIGLTGFVAMPTRGKALRSFLTKYLPPDRLLIETDAPFMHPVPSGKKQQVNEPAFLPYVAYAIARLYRRSVEDVARVSTQNAIRFFSLSPRFQLLTPTTSSLEP